MQRRSKTLLDQVRWPQNLYTACWPLSPTGWRASSTEPLSDFTDAALERALAAEGAAPAPDDLACVSAALRRHPLLLRSPSTTAALVRSLSQPVSYPVGTSLMELGADFADLHLLVSGAMKIIATYRAGTGRAKNEEITRIQAGQWLGLPALLRSFELGHDWPTDGDLVLRAIATEPITTRRIPRPKAIELLSSDPTFRAFAEHNVAVRWARRKEMLGCIEANAYLRFLPPARREYLLQQGAIRKTPPQHAIEDTPLLYMEAGKTSGRIAFLLSGEASAYLPPRASPSPGASPRKPASPLFVGHFLSSDLIGHESLVAQAMADDAPSPSTKTPGRPIVEEKRITDVYLTQSGSGTELLEFEWRVVQRMLESEPPIWDRLLGIMTGKISPSMPLASMICLFGAKPGLGTSCLAYGLAASLAEEEEKAQSNAKIVLLDLQGARHFRMQWQPLGFSIQRKSAPLLPYKQRSNGGQAAADEISYSQLVPKGEGWPQNLDIVWPENPDHLEQLLDVLNHLRTQMDVHAIVIAGHRAATQMRASDVQLYEAIAHLCSHVLVVDDDSIAPYPFGDAEPSNLTYVHRMTAAYRAREQKRAKQVPYDWSLGHWMRYLPKRAQTFVEHELGFAPVARLEADQRLTERRLVRVPDDADGYRLYQRGDLKGLVQRNELPLSRAFGRLGRVIEGRTVGVALGGGGAWGFAHIALIRNLEDSGVPIDYISGASFGSVIGGIYAGGGRTALEKLVQENSEGSEHLLGQIKAAVTSPITRGILLTMLHGAFLDIFMHGFIRRTLPKGAELPTLGTTEIPFAPIASELTELKERTDLRSTIGWGVRASGSLPPFFMPMARLGETIIDGAIIAPVPANVLKQLGADFIIAANVVPSRVSGAATLFDLVPSQLFRRIGNLQRTLLLLGAQAAIDQAHRHAQHAVHMESKDFQFWELWKSSQIIEHTTESYFSGPAEETIAQKWRRFGTHAQRIAESRLRPVGKDERGAIAELYGPLDA